MSMTAIALPANAIVTLENAKTMTPAALAISAGLLAYLSAGIFMPSSHLEEPAIAQAPVETVKPTNVVKFAPPKPKIARAHNVVQPAAKHQHKPLYDRNVNSCNVKRITTIDSAGRRTSVEIGGAQEVATAPLFGRAGKAPPLTQSHIFENLFRIPPREA